MLEVIMLRLQQSKVPHYSRPPAQSTFLFVSAWVWSLVVVLVVV